MNISENHVKLLVQEPYYSRGKDYCKDGMVRITSLSDTEIKAKVVGNNVYVVQVRLLPDNVLEGSCSCYAFNDFGPCKHIAAACFSAILRITHNRENFSRECAERVAEFEQFERKLLQKTKTELIEIIIQLSNDNPEIIYDFCCEDY